MSNKIYCADYGIGRRPSGLLYSEEQEIVD